MIRFKPTGVLRLTAFTLLVLAVMPARASEVSELRAELEAMKASYQAQVAALEARLAQLEAQVAASSAAAPPAAPAAAGPSGGNAQNAFNPAVAVILGGRYAQLSEDPAAYRIAGFMPAGDGVGPGPRGFDLGESELTLAANVDPYFFANLTTAITGDNSISVEEAYVKTIALSSGLSLKAGRFFSGLGYVERDTQPRLGFRGSTPRVPGDVRRPAGAGRCAAQVGGAHRPVRRARRGDGQRRAVSAHAPPGQWSQRRGAAGACGR